VYISGAEVFDVNDVRAAFEEVRNVLKLDSDTILFGVPVDEDAEITAVVKPAPDVCMAEDLDDKDINEIDETESVCQESEDDQKPEEYIEPDDIEDEKPDSESIVEDSEVIVPAPTPDADEPVVPILSVLASKEEPQDVVPEAPAEMTQEEPIKEVKAKTKKTKAKKVVPESEILAEPEDDMSDFLNDDMPEEPSEKTLEELLETMAPLREDVTNFHRKNKADDEPVATTEEIDVTLEKLAGEFAENQDKVPTPKKGAERGKIGKLKNILPFKKMKRDDSGLMGDLFGWAGIAANDDDFTMPGFFK
jgi:hypothetical protein